VHVRRTSQPMSETEAVTNVSGQMVSAPTPQPSVRF